MQLFCVERFDIRFTIPWCFLIFSFFAISADSDKKVLRLQGAAFHVGNYRRRQERQRQKLQHIRICNQHIHCACTFCCLIFQIKTNLCGDAYKLSPLVHSFEKRWFLLFSTKNYFIFARLILGNTLQFKILSALRLKEVARIVTYTST